MLDVQYALTPPEDLTEEQVLLMLNRKTGALLEYAAWCGAKIGLGGKADPGNVASKLGKFASMCGTAFQLRDDLLGLTADEATLGKSVGSDIREGKRTLIVHRALATTSGEQRNRILSALGKPQASNDEVERAIQAIVDSGAAHQVNELANELITEAETLLSALPDTPQRKHLASWASFLLSRQY